MHVIRNIGHGGAVCAIGAMGATAAVLLAQLAATGVIALGALLMQ